MIDDKIYLVTYLESDSHGHQKRIVSHGIGNNTDRTIVLSQDPIDWYSPKRDEIGYYIPCNEEIES